MKLKLIASLTLFLITLTLVSCDESQEIEKVDSYNPYIQLVGKVEHRKANANELGTLEQPTTSKANCTLGRDADCSDGRQSSFERFVKDCTTFPRTWPPTGNVTTFYKSMIYYVDSDGDINMNNYQDDLQAHVDQIINVVSTAAFITADIIYWKCNDQANNSCVIKYTVYK